MVTALLITLLSQPAALAAEPSFRVKTVKERKEDLGKTKNSRERFLAQSKLVEKLSTSPIEGSSKGAAEMLLKAAESHAKDWNYPNALHHAHTLLGRVALKNGNKIEAAKQLSLSAKVKPSPQLSSFGPGMLLAKELLEQGEKVPVLKYFEACQKFWSTPEASSKLAEWKLEVEAGKIPHFGANLRY